MPVITIGENTTDDYTGCIDNGIHHVANTSNFGTNTEFELYRDATDNDSALMKFTLPGVLAGATINSATVTLTKASAGYAGGGSPPVQFFACLVAWGELDSSFNNRTGQGTGSPVSWNTAGCGGEGTDRRATADASTNVAETAAGTTYDWDVTDLVQDWVDGVITNNGFLLKLGSTDGLSLPFASSEHATDGYRPVLEVDYSTSGTLNVTSISDATLTHGQTGIVVNLTGYSASGKTVKVSPTDDPDDAAAVSQTVTAQDGSSITFTAVLSSFSFGTTLYVFVYEGGTTAQDDGEPVSRVIASASLQFTGSDKFINESGAAAASITGMTMYVWRAARPPSSGGTPDQIITGVATDSNGELTQSINLGSLTSSSTIFYILFAADGTDVFSAGEKLPAYA